MRLIRWIVALVVFVIVVTLVAGEVVARPMAEKAVAREVQKRYQLDQQPVVHLGGFPFVVRVAMGRLPSATGELQSTTVQGLRVDAAALRLSDVRFDPGRLAGGNGKVTAQQGTATATVTDADLNNFLRAHDTTVQVHFQNGKATASGRFTIEGQDIDLSGSGQLTFVGNQLHFQVDRVAAEGHQIPAALLDRYRDRLGYTITVPPIAGVQLTSVAVEDGHVRLAANVSAYLLAD